MEFLKHFIRAKRFPLLFFHVYGWFHSNGMQFLCGINPVRSDENVTNNNNNNNHNNNNYNNNIIKIIIMIMIIIKEIVKMFNTPPYEKLF